jgi:hypothetical protein
MMKNGAGMKKRNFAVLIVILTFSLLLVVGCGMSTDQLAKKVRESIEETWAEEDIDAKIQEFTLIKKSKTEYKGILKVSAEGETQNFTVNVTYDGKNLMWQIEE